MSKATDRIKEDLSGVKGQGFLLIVLLKDFAETLESRAASRGLTAELQADVQHDPNWLDKWGKLLGMDTQLLVYMVGAQTLLKEYTAEVINEHGRKKLIDET